jgi:soluble lytic murein transglycosylase
VLQADAPTATIDLPAAPGRDLAGAAEAALKSADPLVGAALAWDAIHQHPSEAGLPRIIAFLRAHADWPQAGLRRSAEELALVEATPAEQAAAYIAEFPPLTPAGQLTLALFGAPREGQATGAERARKLWRDSDLTPALEDRLRGRFGADLSAADHLRRAERLILRGQMEGAARAARLGGKEPEALYRAAADILDGAPDADIAARVPRQLAQSPALLFARIRALRKAGPPEDEPRRVCRITRDGAIARQTSHCLGVILAKLVVGD